MKAELKNGMIIQVNGIIAIKGLCALAVVLAVLLLRANFENKYKNYKMGKENGKGEEKS